MQSLQKNKHACYLSIRIILAFMVDFFNNMAKRLEVRYDELVSKGSGDNSYVWRDYAEIKRRIIAKYRKNPNKCL